MEVLWSDLSEISRRAPGGVGVLGQNLLASFNYVLDYERRVLLFEPEGGFECRWGGERLPMESHERRPMVTVRRADKRGPALRLLLDSGVGSLVLFDSGAQKLAAELNFTNPGLAHATTDAGTKAVTMAQLTRLKIGGASFTNLPVALLTEPAVGTARTEDGLLPLALFRSLCVNNRHGYLIVNPRLNF